MTTNGNNFKGGELVKEESFIAIFNHKGELKGVVRKDVEGGGAVQMFTTRKANYTAFLELLTMLATLGKSWGYRGVQPVDEKGIIDGILEVPKVIPKHSTSFAHDIHPTPRPH